MGFLDLTDAHLRDVLVVLDRHLEGVHRTAAAVPDPDAFGVFDRAEWSVGLGFTACQAYMADVLEYCTSSTEKPRELHRRGPAHPCGYSVATIVHAAANHWKHSADSSPDSSSRSRYRTEVLNAVLGGEQDYVCCYVLLELLDPKPPRFEHLIPLLEQWRDALS